jgi:putative sigma-54 modulation protein
MSAHVRNMVGQGDGQHKEGWMRIEIKGRNVVVGDELKERIEKRCEKVARQVSPLAVMDVELSEERNPSIKDGQIAECTLRLKGVTLRSRSAATTMTHAVNEAADEMARQVKRHRDKRRDRRASREVEARPAASP